MEFNSGFKGLIPDFKDSSTNLSSRRSGFDLSTVRVRVVVYEVAMVQVYLRTLLYPPSIVPLTLYTLLNRNKSLIRRTSGRRMEPFKTSVFFFRVPGSTG